MRSPPLPNLIVYVFGVLKHTYMSNFVQIEDFSVVFLLMYTLYVTAVFVKQKLVQQQPPKQ